MPGDSPHQQRQMPNFDKFQLRPHQPRDLPAIIALFQASVSQLTTQHYDAAQRQAWAPANAELPAWQTHLASI
jgi:putative acetyltransferase